MLRNLKHTKAELEKKGRMSPQNENAFDSLQSVFLIKNFHFYPQCEQIAISSVLSDDLQIKVVWRGQGGVEVV